MTLHLHRAARTDLLADELGGLLATPLADPFASEVVVVPARGVERWLTQRLSHRLGAGPSGGDGVCAGVRFLQPASLVGMLLGRDRDDPWHPDRLVWPLLATIDDSVDEPWCTTLATHLGHGLDGEEGELRRSRRWSVARRLAELFASYAVQRPALVRDWREGRDTDGAGAELAPDLAWEAELWRRLLARMAEAGHAEAPDVRHDRVCAALRAGEVDGLDLPDRLSLFGHTRLPETEIDLLVALAAHRDVHLWLAQPSAALWSAVSEAGTEVGPRDESTSAELAHHPLLASLGRDSRELATVLGARVRAGEASDAGAAPDPGTPDDLLGWLQGDLRANRVLSAEERAARVMRPDDRSLQVHACHGPARQVEVLRELLVGLLEDDPTLEPRDIVVMCPDVEAYAPLISAGFGMGELIGDSAGAGGPGGAVLHPAHQLRVRLADRATSSTNPLLAVAVVLVELAGGRATASEVLDLLARPVCRRRFGFTDDDLARMTRWVAEAGVRWGIDATQRAAYAMDGFEHNTWRAGLDRLLLGVAMSDDDHRHVGRGLPVDDIASGEIELVGRMSEAVARLGACLAALDVATAADQWFAALTEGVRDLCEVEDDDAWQLPQFERELARACVGAGSADESDEDNRGVPLRLADVRALLQARLAGRPTRANFRTGTLTVCTMVPMRSVPHRVVCLVGLDDGVFPRASGVNGDDVLGRRPRVGERDLRGEDRQLLLDAILAAGERLVITYTGAAEHTGQERPPAVPLGELLDALDRTAASPVREQVVVRHPLQGFDPRNHVPGELVGTGPFSFDRASLAGARASVRERTPVPSFLPGALPARPEQDVSLADLVDFVLRPARTFLRGRLDVATPFEPGEVADAIPVDLDNLEKWAIGDRLLQAVLTSEDPATTGEAVMLAEQLRGSLPPFGLGYGALGAVVADCQALLQQSAALRSTPARSVDVDVDLGGGRRLTGTVPRVHGNQLVDVTYSRPGPKQRITSWLQVVALSASHPDESWTSHAIARARSGPQRALAGPLDHRAVEWLRAVVGLYDEGAVRPLPIPVKTAHAWAEARAKELRGIDVDPVAAAAGAWTTDRFHPLGIAGEDDDAAHRRIWGHDAPVSVLIEAGLPTYAWTLWEPLLAGAERVGPL